VHLLGFLVVWNFIGMCRLVAGVCTGGGGVSQRLPAESCVGWVSGGGADPSLVLAVCCVTAVVLRVTLISCPKVLKSGGVWGSRRSVSSAATSVALVGMVPVRMVFWIARRLMIPCGPMSLVLVVRVGAAVGGAMTLCLWNMALRFWFCEAGGEPVGPGWCSIPSAKRSRTHPSLGLREWARVMRIAVVGRAPGWWVRWQRLSLAERWCPRMRAAGPVIVEKDRMRSVICADLKCRMLVTCASCWWRFCGDTIGLL
jgi:hypothetical protein